MKTLPVTNDSDTIDLESSSQIEMDRTVGCDSDSVVIEPHTAAGIAEPHHRHSPSEQRELLQNCFPPEE